MTGMPVAAPRAGINAAEPGAPRRRGLATHGSATPWLFLAPYLVLFTVFVLIPAVYGLWISLHNWDPFLDVKPWEGL